MRYKLSIRKLANQVIAATIIVCLSFGRPAYVHADACHDEALATHFAAIEDCIDALGAAFLVWDAAIDAAEQTRTAGLQACTDTYNAVSDACWADFEITEAEMELLAAAAFAHQECVDARNDAYDDEVAGPNEAWGLAGNAHYECYDAAGDAYAEALILCDL